MTEAELVLTHILRCGRSQLYLHKDNILQRSDACRLAAILKRRISGEPVHYILGSCEFMGLEFEVTPDVLIPRPETEILVETAIKYAQGSRVKAQGEKGAVCLRILDIGTGSGCIAVSLAKLLNDCEITAPDISAQALKTASTNARRHGVDSRIKFIHTDIFSLEPSALSLQPFDLIISNPPYIRSPDIDSLQREIRHEPRGAIDGGPDGLVFYRRLVCAAPGFLRRDGVLILEAGFGQIEDIRNIFHNSRKFEIIKVIKDYAGIDRVIVAGLTGLPVGRRAG